MSRAGPLFEGAGFAVSAGKCERAEGRYYTALYMYPAKTSCTQVMRLETQGFGDAKPVADNRTDEGRARNRRVKLVKL